MQTAPAVDPQLRREGMPGLRGKDASVTGGSSGIGQAIAVRFAEHGANVAINFLTTPDEATGTKEQLHACVRKVQQQGVRDVLVQGDISPEDDVVRPGARPRLRRQARHRLLADQRGSSRPTQPRHGGPPTEHPPREVVPNTEPHKRLLAKLKDLLGALGCHQGCIPRWSVLSQQIPIAGIAHSRGTIRFGTDPKRSALDVNCKRTTSTTSTSWTPASSRPPAR
jgi:short chain dehydrogenase